SVDEQLVALGALDRVPDDVEVRDDETVVADEKARAVGDFRRVRVLGGADEEDEILHCLEEILRIERGDGSLYSGRGRSGRGLGWTRGRFTRGLGVGLRAARGRAVRP